jgi:ADP-dependent NAD(P)H-hydrate dehydratase
MSTPDDVSIESLKRFPLPPLDDANDKEDRGAVLVVAGGGRVPGAGILTGLAALRAGAGKLQLAATRACAVGLGMTVPEAAVVSVPAMPTGEISSAAAKLLSKEAARADAVVVGPGMVDRIGAAQLALALVNADHSAAFVLDAAALTGLDFASRPTRVLKGRLVVTPHAGEMAKLTGASKETILADPIGAARDLSEALDAVVVMKGDVSFIVTPQGQVWRHPGGAIGLGTSGSGDVLAGVIAGLLARGAPPETAAVWGVCVHAQAGVILADRLGTVGFLARELLTEIPGVIEAAGGQVRSRPA